MTPNSRSYLNRWTSPDSIIPDPSDPIAFDRYAYSRNNPIRYIDPSGHDWWDAVGQFATGFVTEFALRNVGWISPDAQRDLAVNASESSASLAGRVAADMATIVLGIENVATGTTIATGGTVVACGATLCLGAGATVAGGVAVAAVGASQVAQGAIGLGGNLALLTGDKNSGTNSFLDDWAAKKPFEGTVQNPDGTITEYEVRPTPGRDGGWSRIVRVRDANGNTISVTHEAWKGLSDPRFDPPDHTDFKPVNKKR